MSTELDLSIRRQVEFYFSDSNLPNDKFLKAELESNDGWCRISTLTLFQRLKKLSEDVTVIADALRPSNILEVSEDGLKVKRTTEIPDDLNLVPLTVYAKGFPLDSTLDSITEYLKTKDIEPECVRLRTYKTATGERGFKGSVLLQFKTEEEAQKILEEGIVNQNGNKMITMSYAAYLEEEKNENDEKSAKKNAKAAADRAKKAEREARQAELEASLLKRFGPTEFEPNHLLSFTNMPDGSRREVIMEVTKKLGYEVQFIDFERGRTSGTIKFASTDIEDICKAMNDSAKDISEESPPVFTVLTGDEERNTWNILEVLKEERFNEALNPPQKRKGPFKRKHRNRD